MRFSLARCPWAILGLALAASCKYDPNPEEGKQQCYQGTCVDGYVCAYDGLCYTPANLPVAPGTGGVVGTGGKTGSGGVIGAGGMTGYGGVTGKGGATGYGGLTSYGGVTGYGGVAGYGGVTGQGGASSTGGTTTPPNAGTVMTIANNQAQGAMTGYGWVAFGAADSVTDPTCGSPAGYLISGTPCELTIWSSADAYCVTGYIPAVTSSSEYTTNWGISMGVDATPDPAGVLGQSFVSLSAQVTGVPQSGLRLFAHRKGDAESVTYCATMTSGQSVAFSKLNTACWDASGTYLAAADVPNLDRIGVQVPSTTSAAITVTSLCLRGITFAR